MSLIVQKFGGSSVADVDKIRRVARIVADAYDQGDQVVAVVSAMGKTTDGLVALASQVMEHPCGRDYDALLATGEMVTTALLAVTLNAMGYKAVGLNGGQAGIRTEDLFNRARIVEIETGEMRRLLDDGVIVIVTGFQGIDSAGNITTLGRGGSDTSAVALAGALNADRCDIYTDVRGVFSTDPRIVPHAVKQDRMAYVEMLELARVGAKVLHPRSVETARKFNVKLFVRSTFDLDDPGTMVLGVDPMELERPVAGIACDENQARLALTGVPDRPGVAADVFGKLAARNVSVDMIIQSLPSHDGPGGEHTNDIAFTVGVSDLPVASQTLEEVKAQLGARAVLTDPDVAKVSIVGAGMVDRPGIAADMFKSLAAASINIKMITTSEIKISCLVAKSDAKRAVQEIHHIFFPQSEASAEVLVNQKLGY
ncbi:MAG: aspartate kinase [Vampirovibrionales bacterium]|nr:aspartate kinase [Vampirovibrionales bacterium]